MRDRRTHATYSATFRAWGEPVEVKIPARSTLMVPKLPKKPKKTKEPKKPKTKT